MATFVYEAFTRTGDHNQGTIEAETPEDARVNLKGQGLLVLELRQSKTASLGKAEIRLGGSKVKMKDVAWAARNLATTQSAGLPIVRALKMLGQQREKEPIGATLLRVHEKVVNGAALGEAFQSEEQHLGALTTALIEAGESSGKLDTSLAKLADLCDARVRLKRKIMSAMAYPVVMVALVIGIFFAMLILVVPTFKTLYTQVKGTMPPLTRYMLAASAFSKGHVYLFPIFGFGVWFGLRFLKTNAKAKAKRDSVMLRLPLLGSLFRATAVARLATTLASSLGAGVPLLDALQLSASVANNAEFSTAIEDARQQVRDGRSLAAALAPQKVIPDLFTQLVAIGEETGAVDDLLVKYAKTVEDEVETKVEGLTSTLEPLMIVVFGAVIGVMVIALYLPLISLLKFVK
jgi:type IV pilus assembly protein PilC